MDSNTPRTFTSSDGFCIIAGRNAVQNDYITTKMTAPLDIWLHVVDGPGSHVVIQCGHLHNADLTLSIMEAAQIALYHSSLRECESADVMYTCGMNVSKPEGSEPGTVSVTNWKKITVHNDPDLVKRLCTNVHESLKPKVKLSQ